MRQRRPITKLISFSYQTTVGRSFPAKKCFDRYTAKRRVNDCTAVVKGRKLLALLRKQRIHILKRLKFNRVAGRVEEEHGGLFAGFAFEADVRLDDEFGAGGLQAVGELVPLLHAEHNAEVAARDVVTVDVAGFGRRSFVRR